MTNEVMSFLSEDKQKLNFKKEDSKTIINDLVFIKKTMFKSGSFIMMTSILDFEGKVILQRKSNYDKNKIFINSEYEQIQNWKENLSKKIDIIEEKIKIIKKETALDKVRNIANQFRTFSSGNTFKI